MRLSWLSVFLTQIVYARFKGKNAISADYNNVQELIGP